jgi:hypothetical protein
MFACLDSLESHEKRTREPPARHRRNVPISPGSERGVVVGRQGRRGGA